jgi:hypothetical protein
MYCWASTILFADQFHTYQGFRTHYQEGDTSQISPLSGLAMAAVPSSIIDPL